MSQYLYFASAVCVLIEFVYIVGNVSFNLEQEQLSFECDIKDVVTIFFNIYGTFKTKNCRVHSTVPKRQILKIKVLISGVLLSSDHKIPL